MFVNHCSNILPHSCVLGHINVFTENRNIDVDTICKRTQQANIARNSPNWIRICVWVYQISQIKNCSVSEEIWHFIKLNKSLEFEIGVKSKLTFWGTNFGEKYSQSFKGLNTQLIDKIVTSLQRNTFTLTFVYQSRKMTFQMRLYKQLTCVILCLVNLKLTLCDLNLPIEP